MKITALSGVGTAEPSGVSTASAAVGWALIIGTVVAVFVGTLMLRPEKGD